MKTKLIPVALFCLLNLQGANAAKVPESPEGSWNTSGTERVSFKGKKQSAPFADFFTFHQSGSFTTGELGFGQWTQTGSKLTMTMSNQELLTVINGYFDSLGYGGIIYAESVESFKFSGKVSKGRLSGTFKWGFTVSAPDYGVNSVKASIMGKFSGNKVSAVAKSGDSADVPTSPLHGVAKRIVDSIVK